MPYTPNSWQTGDTINAAPLNTLEAGVQAAYDRSQHFGSQAASTVTGLASVATTGNYSDLTGTPALAAVAASGAYADLSGRPTLATVAQSGAYADLSGKPSIAAGAGITVSTTGTVTTVTATGTGGGSSDADFGAVVLDSFQTGSLNDDQLLSAAMSAIGAETYPRTILLSNRLYSFATGNIQPYEGFRMHGAWGYSNPERNSGNKVAAPVSLNMNGPWFTAGTSTIYGVSMGNLALEGHGTNATFIGGSTGTFYCLSLENISSNAMRSVLGTQATKILLTAATFSGWWEINNSYSGAFHIGGSDNTLWTDGMLLDSGTAFNTAGSANGQYQLWLDFCEKTYVGPVYITAEGAWNGVRVSGPAFNTGGGNLGGPVWINGARIEGRNAGAPCNGALVRVEGGSLNLRDCWVSYGMASPATPAHAPADAGIIHQEGGQLAVHGCTYDKATSVAETVPWVYSNSAGDAVVYAAQRGSKGGNWTGRPRFAKPVANGENRIADATVTQITV